jgi:uncharacterized protein
MDTLFAKMDRLLQLTQTRIVRGMMNRINWDARLIAIRGARGIGKTTLMLQYIKLHYKQYDRHVLYCSLDSVYFSTHSLTDLADDFYKNGGRHLFLDEVHKYKGWSREVKELYDMYPDMRVVITGSSLLHILNGDADLSRRCVPYEMQGLSFREYLQFYQDIVIEPVSLEDVLEHPENICGEVNSKCQPLPLFKDYLKHGYYPFYLDNQRDYYTTIENIIDFTISVELVQLCNVSPANIRKIKALVGILAQTVPYEVDITKLASLIGVQRNTVIDYLRFLGDARVLNLLYADLVSVKKMQKPDKIYLENANLIYTLATEEIKIGTVREAFTVNQLGYGREIEYGKQSGDFRVNGKYLFEVGGKTKSFDQIADIPNSYVLADDIETPIGKKLPLWSVGFLY